MTTVPLNCPNGELQLAIWNESKQSFEVVSDPVLAEEILKGKNIHPKDDLVKEAMAAIHGDDKMKALQLLSDALKM